MKTAPGREAGRRVDMVAWGLLNEGEGVAGDGQLFVGRDDPDFDGGVVRRDLDLLAAYCDGIIRRCNLIIVLELTL